MSRLQWDIFCKVIDNLGDIGVGWRLAADLAARGHQVRLWVDDATALAWMAPDGCAGVRLVPWTGGSDFSCLIDAPGDVLVETFGCEIAPEVIAAFARIYCSRCQNNLNSVPPLWLNLEYLTAEPYAERSHGLPSLVQTGPATGWKKWFFYPGFTEKTGGLLREANVKARQSAFDRAAWLSQVGVDWQGSVVVFLFCYEPATLAKLLQQLNAQGINGKCVTLMVAAGRATEAVKLFFNEIDQQPNEYGCQQLLNLLSITYLPKLTQLDFDHALWSADINFVRGEDSLVRAIWAGKPFVWQIYPQDDGAHWPKLEAFLDMSSAPPSLRAFTHWWNGAGDIHVAPVLGNDLAAWQLHAQRLMSTQSGAANLTSQIEQFALKNR